MSKNYEKDATGIFGCVLGCFYFIIFLWSVAFVIAFLTMILYLLASLF